MPSYKNLNTQPQITKIDPRTIGYNTTPAAQGTGGGSVERAYEAGGPRVDKATALKAVKHCLRHSGADYGEALEAFAAGRKPE